MEEKIGKRKLASALQAYTFKVRFLSSRQSIIIGVIADNLGLPHGDECGE